MYAHYKLARDMAWKTLIDCGITSLPIKLTDIAKHYHLKVLLYSTQDVSIYGGDPDTDDGFITKIGNKKMIYLNDHIHSLPRQRFTLGHELGHALLNHPLDIISFRNSETEDPDNPLELEANVFSRVLLAPACVLWGLGVETADDMMHCCNVSRQFAEFRLARLQLLRKRNRFLTHPLERQVYEQFQNYIETQKSALLHQ